MRAGALHSIVRQTHGSVSGNKDARSRTWSVRSFPTCITTAPNMLLNLTLYCGVVTVRRGS
jgi:hypothetical protein